jgi:hypothetical protein
MEWVHWGVVYCRHDSKVIHTEARLFQAFGYAIVLGFGLTRSAPACYKWH